MTRKLFSALTLLAGCISGTDDPNLQVQRVPLAEVDQCAESGDCCADRLDACEASDAPACGGLAGLPCDEGFYCDYGADTNCGFADQTGVCRQIPASCGDELAPVCGCDGQTYDNACWAALAHMSVWTTGTCDEGARTQQSCGGPLEQTCGPDSYCSYELGTCGAAGALGTCEVMPEVCSKIYLPVCGCDGLTYSNACMASTAGVSLASEGACQAPAPG